MTHSNDTLAAPAVQAITFETDASPDGHVAATIPISWTLNDKTLDFINRKRNRNPHLLVVVASKRTHNSTRSDFSAADAAQEEAEDNGEELSDEAYRRLIEHIPIETTHYDITSVQAIQIFKRNGELATQKTFVSFHRHGDNIIVGKLIAVTDKDDAQQLQEWIRHPSRLHLEASNGGVELEGSGGGRGLIALGEGLSSRPVVVPPEMFARERPKWQKNLVRQFFRGQENDECHFRKRLWFVAIPATFFLQLYGLVARIIILLYALFMLSRDTFTKELFAFFPHDYARSLGTSRWLENDQYEDRPTWIQAITPPAIALYGLLLFVSMLPGSAIVALYNHANGIEGAPNLLQVWLWGWAFDLAVGLIIFGCWLLTSNGRDWYLINVSRRINRLRPHSAANGGKVVLKDPQSEDETRLIDALRQAQLRSSAPNEIDNTTIWLKFQDLKMRVCRPFSRP